MKKLLIVEDEPAVRLLVSATLASEDYEILEAATGQRGLELARSHRPDVALLDVGLPDLDGFDICRQVKADAETSDTVVVMLTGAAHPEDVKRGMAAGAARYLTKPFSPIQLIGMVQEWMN